MNKNKDICCPVFEPDRYHNKRFIWKDKLFLKDEVFQIMHIPVNMGRVVARMFKKIENSNASPDPKDFLMLCYDPSQWKSEVYMTVTKAIPGDNMAKLSGKFVSRVYDGPYNAVPNWIQDMDRYLLEKGEAAKKYYFHYAYCPKCSKKYGHNYCVAFVELGG
jgi:hypothetical protein